MKLYLLGFWEIIKNIEQSLRLRNTNNKIIKNVTTQIKMAASFLFALKLLAVLVVRDIDFIADFDGFIGYTTNVLLKIFGFTVRMSA